MSEAKDIERRWVMGGQITGKDVEWLIEQAEKVERYEKALNEIAEYSGTDLLGKACARIAKKALEV